MRYKVTISYDGSSYYGWQTQHLNNSVQEEIEAVLKIMHNQEVEVVSSGRTDAHVHAIGQVIHFDSSLDISEERMKVALNSQLPKTIRVKNVEIVDENFHARFSAISKRYDYYLTSDNTNPFIYNYMEVDTYKLDLNKMKEVSTIFLGTHDFTSFTSSKVHELKSKVRTITKLDIIQEDEVIHFIIEGDGFLRYMVRMIVQTIIMAGKDKVSYDEVKMMLDGKNKHLCKYKANPNGLYLVEVKYE